MEQQATGDDHLVALWLHGRPLTTQRVYSIDIRRMRAFRLKPFIAVTLTDLQDFSDSLAGNAPSTRHRTLSAVKSLFTFAHKLGYLQYDVARALRLCPMPMLRARRSNSCRASVVSLNEVGRGSFAIRRP
ncbi:MAG: integrase/recombinase XerD [Bryobacterales bacterium]|nr:integrase/recombinase XerD [Bryobacterales bacterium]